MQMIEIDIVNKVATVRGYPSIVLGNNDYSVKFYFDSEWDGYTSKTLSISMLSAKTGMLQTKEILFQGDTVDLPAILNTGEISISVSAGDALKSSNAVVVCFGEINPSSNPHPNPEPNVYSQLMEYLAGLQGGGAGFSIALNSGASAGAAGAATIIEEGE